LKLKCLLKLAKAVEYTHSLIIDLKGVATPPPVIEDKVKFLDIHEQIT
jgi:hypothetical protein